MAKAEKGRKLTPERQERIRSLMRDYVEGGWLTNNELAIRYGISDGMICQDLKVVRELIRDGWGEEDLKQDMVKRLAQLERVMAKAFRDYEVSRQNEVEISTRYEKRWCKRCKGEGEIDGTRCEKCEGKGYKIEEIVTRKEKGQAGDPRFLTIIQKGIQEICKLKAHYPERKKTVEKKVNLNITTDFDGVDPELVLEHRRLMLKMEESRSKGASDNEDVVDVEFEKVEDEK